MKIALTENELREAAQEGERRMIWAIMHDGRNVNGETDNLWQHNIEGACAEKAVSKALKLPWHKYEKPCPGPDVGPFHVRHSEDENHRLSLHHSDADDDTTILVTGHYGIYCLEGWIVNRNGKQGGFWCEPNRNRWCFLVPQWKLKPMPEIFRHEVFFEA